MGGTHRMPALFLGHGSPMNALEDSEFQRGWSEAARRLPRPEAILCVSAHWETGGVFLTAADHPETVHDFLGFPEALYAVRYPAPGHPALARKAASLLRSAQAGLDAGRGLDHGCWSVLRAMYPAADVPVVQLSLDATRPAALHYELARELRPLRSEGVLILGSGDVVHNLRRADFGREDGDGWAVGFDAEVRGRALRRDHAALVDYPSLTPDARWAVPTPEHYLPLLYVLAQQDEDEEVAVFNERVVMASISMTCYQVGAEPAGGTADRRTT